MSSIILLKDHEGAKKGTTISVPFHRGRNLIDQGIGAYLDQSKPPKPTESAESQKSAEADRLRKINEDLRKQLEEKQQHIDELLATAPPVKSSGDGKEKK